MWFHLSALSGYLPLPFVGFFIGPLIFRIFIKKKFPEDSTTLKKILNFQISFSLYMVLALLTIHYALGLVLVISLIIYHVTMVVKASVKARIGDEFSYPLAIRFLK